MRHLVRLELAHAHETPHVAGKALGHDGRFAQFPSFVARAAAHQVRSQGVVTFHLAGLGHFESLGDALAGLVFVTHRFLVK